MVLRFALYVEAPALSLLIFGERRLAKAELEVS
jgi:hypothetical protein